MMGNSVDVRSVASVEQASDDLRLSARLVVS